MHFCDTFDRIFVFCVCDVVLMMCVGYLFIFCMVCCGRNFKDVMMMIGFQETQARKKKCVL